MSRLIVSLLVVVCWLLSKSVQDVPLPTPTPKPDVKEEPKVGSADVAEVTEVIDGDTIKVNNSGIRHTIRLIGIDTPELHDPRSSVECYALEASENMKKLVLHQPVQVMSDPSQANQDRYGRLLRYIRLPDGQDVGLILISEGYAHEYTYQTPYSKQKSYKEAETMARAGQRGLWGNACVQPTPNH